MLLIEAIVVEYSKTIKSMNKRYLTCCICYFCPPPPRNPKAELVFYYCCFCFCYNYCGFYGLYNGFFCFKSIKMSIKGV